jgi:hypothetical protein
MRLHRLNPKPLPHPPPDESAGKQRMVKPPMLAQQSASVTQISHAGRQPPKSWQVGAPSPLSAHNREQHSPEPEQGCPAARHPVVETHRPIYVPASGLVRLQFWPFASHNWHVPLQHSPPRSQTSPSALQFALNAQRKACAPSPPTNTQFREQHPPPLVEGLQTSPADAQFVAGPKGPELSEIFWHVVLQTLVQHSALPEHASPAGSQIWPVAQTPLAAPPSAPGDVRQ